MFQEKFCLFLTLVVLAASAVDAQTTGTSGTTGTTGSLAQPVANTTGSTVASATAGTPTVPPTVPPVETHGLTTTQNAWLEAALIGVYIVLGCIVLSCCIGFFAWAFFWYRRPTQQAFAYAQMQQQKVQARAGQFY